MIFALVGTAVLLAVGWVLRRLVPVRGPLTAVIPVAIMGGFVALVLRAAGVLPGSPEAWQDVAYHLFGISFLAIGLTPLGGTKLRKGALWMGMGQWATFTLQAAVGGLIAIAIGSLHAGFGFLTPMGLNEGPGQALSIGRLWEADYGFSDAASIGATIASVGFVIAYVGGLFAVRGRRGRVAVVGGFYRFNRRAAVTGGVIVVGYIAIYEAVLRGLGAVAPDLVDLVLGVLFFVTLLVGMAARGVLERAGVSIDGGHTRQVTLLAVDGLTVAILGSLTWEAVSGVIWPLVAVVAGGLGATLVVLAVASRWIDAWRFERSLALFGTVTGTVASGLALLALTDPDLESPVAAELGAMVIVSAPVVLGGIALVTAAASGSISEIVATGLFAAIGALSLGALAVVMRRVSESPTTVSED